LDFQLQGYLFSQLLSSTNLQKFSIPLPVRGFILKDRGLVCPVGETRLQMKAFLRTNSRSTALLLVGGALLVVAIGCKRPPSPDVMATVNGKDILQAELEKKYLAYRATQGGNSQEPSKEQADIVRLALLRQLIDEEILQQRATTFKLASSDEDVNAKLGEMKAPFTQDDFDKQLKQRNQTLDDLKLDIRHALTQNKLLNKEIESKINITDADISGYYNAHKAEFNFIEPRYNIARIIVSSAPSAQSANLQNNKASSDADAKKKIQALHNKLDSGEDFGSLAMSYSEDKDTGPNGGDMGFIPESQLHGDPQAFEAIGKLKPGQVTEVLSAVDGASHRTYYAIYKLISRAPAGQRELNDPRVQQAIHQQLHENQKQLLLNAYLEVLHDEAKVRNYYAEQILKDGAK
jgi:peptidyl-prolyl cis-trans isomerase SurA